MKMALSLDYGRLLPLIYHNLPSIPSRFCYHVLGSLASIQTVIMHAISQDCIVTLRLCWLAHSHDTERSSGLESLDSCDGCLWQTALMSLYNLINAAPCGPELIVTTSQSWSDGVAAASLHGHHGILYPSPCRRTQATLHRHLSGLIFRTRCPSGQLNVKV